ncbi:MAG TPA: MOSC domain-containing protein [Pseudonocardiaceae bacterium]|jgi:MOSC domain-containing protein YiiM|nr:MOSC domain-containing protein [Pseudonocardiaceae bacterium]
MIGSSGRAAVAEPGRVVSVNVGVARPVSWRDRIVHTAIFKYPVDGRVPVLGVNLVGDGQADRDVHGGPDKAVYAYAREDLDWWAGELGRGLCPGVFGENLTVTGTVVTGAVIGERWRIGTVELEVCGPRVPCYKLGIRMGDDGYPRRFAAAGRPGAYLRILVSGSVGAGDEVVVAHRPDHGVTVGAVAHAFHRDHTRAPEILAAPELAEFWRSWAQTLLDRKRRRPSARPDHREQGDAS